MKPSIVTLLMTVVAACAAEPAVKEERLPGGISLIKITAADGREVASYRVNLSTHHYPPATADDRLVKRFRSWRFGAFLCFNSNQYSGQEFCPSKDPVGEFQPTSLEVKGCIRTIKAAGMKYAVLTVRHTSELLLWDSRTSPINVVNSAYRKDLVKEYVTECRRQGVEPGFYYCLWGNAWRPHPNARAIILAQLHELATCYGKIAYFWLDMPHLTGWLAKDLSQQELYDSLKNIDADTIVMFNHTIQDGSEVKTFPTDVINGEMCQPPTQGHDPVRKVEGRSYYLPFEYELCSQQRGYELLGRWDYPGAAWFTYGSGKSFMPSQPFPAEFLYQRIQLAYQRGAASVLLACAPDYTGKFRQEDVAQLVRLGKMLKDPALAPPPSLTKGCQATASSVWDATYAADKAVDGDPATRWGAARGATNGWLEVDLGKPATISSALISEGWDRVRRFVLQARIGGTWQPVTTGTTLGIFKNLSFEPVSAQVFRLSITEAADVPTIWEFELFSQEVEPMRSSRRHPSE
jgi:alpha-L-fucosidase